MFIQRERERDMAGRRPDIEAQEVRAARRGERLDIELHYSAL